METATEQRALLSDDAIDNHPQPIASANETISARWGMRQARDFYEAKITSGELAVVKTVKRSEAQAHVNSHDYGDIHFEMETYLDTGYQDAILYCPVCGAKIIE